MSSSQDADFLDRSLGPGLFEAGRFLGHITLPWLGLSLLLFAAAFTLGAMWSHGAAMATPRPRPRIVHVSGVRARRPKQQEQQKCDEDGDTAQVWTLELAAQDAGEATPRPRSQEPAPDQRTGRLRDRTMPTPLSPPPPPSFFRDIPSPPPFEQLSARRALRSEVRDASAPPRLW